MGSFDIMKYRSAKNQQGLGSRHSFPVYFFYQVLSKPRGRDEKGRNEFLNVFNLGRRVSLIWV